MAKKAQFGLTTLIIFIALIVTAAVAAGVIIYTTQTMQQKALQTGSEAKERVSTGIDIVRVLGYQFDGNTSALTTNLQRITAVGPVMRLMSGSNPISFNDFTFLMTTDKGKFYSLSTKTESGIPVALHGRLEGGNVIITGFVSGEFVDADPVTFTSATNLTNTDGNITINCTGTGPYTCTVDLNDAIKGVPISMQQALALTEELRKDLNLDAASLLLALNIKGNNIYLEEGEIYEWIMVLNNMLYPEEKYTIQIFPKNGYVAEIKGRIPTVLQSAVVDIYAG